jgi:EmrB/QacA subfamily drug resistance transporter
VSEAEDTVAAAGNATPALALQPTPRSWTIPAIIGSALMMQTLSATVIINALPAMAHSLGEEPLRLNLAITLYLLATAVFMPLSGWMADKFGARRIFMLAIVLYAAAAAASGFAHSLPQLLISRSLQGAAGAMLTPVGRLVLLRTTPKSELVGAMSVLTMPALLGPVLGPLIGGSIVTFFSWRWIFFLNLPIAAFGLFMVSRYVPDVKEREVGAIDIKGMLLTGVGLATLIFGFENLGRGDLPPWGVAVLMTSGVACLAWFGFHAHGRSNAAIDLTIFRIPTFRASVLGGAFMRISIGANPFLLAMLLQVGFGLSALTAGAMTFISAAGALLMKGAAPPILRRFGFRTVLVVNSLIVAVSFFAYTLFRPTTPHWAIMIVLAIGGFFRSLQFTSLNGLAYADIDEAHMSRASTTASMVQQIIQSVGIGLAALAVHVLMRAQGLTHVTPAAVIPAFAMVAAISLVSLFWFVPLKPGAGAELTTRRVRA